MGLLDGVMQGDAVAFNDPDTFGESARVRHRGGAPRPISATIVRHPLATPAELAAGRGVTHQITIVLRNHATLGISSAEFEAGGVWEIELEHRIGGAVRWYPLPELAAQSAGTITFHIGK